MEKECFKCSVIKPITEFYKHKQMGDGHLNKCKECTKKDVAEHRENNLEKIKEYDRNRPNHDERAKRHLQRINRIRLNDPDKFRRMRRHHAELTEKFRGRVGNVHCQVARAVKAGKIAKPSNCSCCNVECNPQGHHHDYSKPLDVIWLCVRCHADEHKRINEQRRQEQKAS